MDSVSWSHLGVDCTRWAKAIITLFLAKNTDAHLVLPDNNVVYIKSLTMINTTNC